LTLLLIALGGTLGALARFLLSSTLQRLSGLSFPVGTLAVNLLGSFLIGLLIALSLHKLPLKTEARAFLITGFLGSFTTFSSFAYEALYLLLNGKYGKFLLYLLLTNALGLTAVFLGYRLGRSL